MPWRWLSSSQRRWKFLTRTLRGVLDRRLGASQEGNRAGGAAAAAVCWPGNGGRAVGIWLPFYPSPVTPAVTVPGHNPSEQSAGTRGAPGTHFGGPPHIPSTCPGATVLAAEVSPPALPNIALLRAAHTGSLWIGSSCCPTGQFQGSEYASRLKASWGRKRDTGSKASSNAEKGEGLTVNQGMFPSQPGSRHLPTRTPQLRQQMRAAGQGAAEGDMHLPPVQNGHWLVGAGHRRPVLLRATAGSSAVPTPLHPHSPRPPSTRPGKPQLWSTWRVLL